mgnify:CR=1 FL=1|jgi:hypothetical protein|tara:strand:- start:372 stop:659 length:288 start_codon:yes stop_codon:yes gene_type:complete
MRLLRLEKVSVDQDFFQIYWFEVMNSAEVVLSSLGIFHIVMIKHISLDSKLFRHGSEHFHEESQMIIIFLMVVARPWIEQEISGDKLKGHTGKTP